MSGLMTIAIDQLRKGVATRPRGSPLRNVCTLLLKRIAHNNRRAATLDTFRPLDRPDLTFAGADSMVNDAVYWYGVQGYEGVLADLWIRLCRDARHVLEVGGNIGFYTVLGGKVARGAYVVVEPVPDNVRILRRNLDLNAIRAIEVLEAAVIPGTVEETVHLNIPDEGRGAPVGAQVSAAIEIAEHQAGRSLAVRGLPFAALADKADLIKIDAEGIEQALLDAALAPIARNRPDIVVELLPDAHKLAALVARIAKDFGYRILVVPAYGSDTVSAVDIDRFDASVPASFNSKDVILASGRNALV